MKTASGGDAHRADVAADDDQLCVNLRFEELGLELANGTRVLNGVNGEIKHSRLTAVMGPSGSGKTTFLSTLSGRASYGTQIGKIFLNGKEENIGKYRGLTGFVPQEDTMIRSLSVEQVLRHSAYTRLPIDVVEPQNNGNGNGSSHSGSTRNVDAIVEDTLRLLSLTEIRHSAIGDEETRGISGGQRKRVNIGIELVSDPRILFCDEPTSGLDSSGSKEVIYALSTFARTYRSTVVIVIHQPRFEIFQLFDDVLLLGKGGYTIFLGPNEDVLPYFRQLGFACPAQCNPSDFLLDVINGDVARADYPDFHHSQLPELWNEHCEAKSKQEAANGNGIVSADGTIAVGGSQTPASVPPSPLRDHAASVAHSMPVSLASTAKAGGTRRTAAASIGSEPRGRDGRRLTLALALADVDAGDRDATRYVRIGEQGGAGVEGVDEAGADEREGDDETDMVRRPMTMFSEMPRRRALTRATSNRRGSLRVPLPPPSSLSRLPSGIDSTSTRTSTSAAHAELTEKLLSIDAASLNSGAAADAGADDDTGADDAWSRMSWHELCFSGSGACGGGVFQLDFWLGFCLNSFAIAYLDYHVYPMFRRYTTVLGAMSASVLLCLGAAAWFVFVAVARPAYVARSDEGAWVSILASACAIMLMAGVKKFQKICWFFSSLYSSVR
jgi:ABC-type multidrug transport system ATPase subunit